MIFPRSSGGRSWAIGRVGGALFQPRAVTYLTLRVNRWIGGVEPLGYHVVNLVIHALAAFSLWGVLREIFVARGRFWPGAVRRWGEALAFLGALVWAVHPVTTQAVAYVIQRAESLWSLFFLVGFWIYLRVGNDFAEDPSPPTPLPGAGRGEPKLKWGWLAVAIAAFWLGMGSKEPILLSLLALPVADRLFGSSLTIRERLMFFGIVLLPVVIAIPMVVMPALAVSDRTATGGLAIENLSPWQYWVTQPEAILHYLLLVVMPLRQNFDYLWPPQDNPLIAITTSAVLIAIVATSIGGLVRRNPWCWFPVLFLLNVGTTSLFPLIDIVVEHRIYLASAWVIAGVLAVAAVGLEAAAKRGVAAGRVKTIAIAGSVVMVAGLGVLTHRRSAIYQSALGLWQDSADKAPWNYRAHHNVGVQWMKLGDPEKAAQAYLRAVNAPSLQSQVDFQQAKVFDGLADALSASGDLDGAVKAAEVAVKLTPGGSDHLMRLADVYAEHQRWDDAERALRRAIVNRPEREELHKHLKTILTQQRKQRYQVAVDSGDLDGADRILGEAVAAADSDGERLFWQVEAARQRGRRGDLQVAASQLQKLTQTHPNDPQIWAALGDVIRWSGNSEGAVAIYQRAVEAGPPTSPLLNNLGALLSASDPRAAEGYLREAVRLDPRNYQAWHSLGNALVRQRRIAEARVCYQTALKIEPGFEPARQTLAKLAQAIEPSGAK